MRACVLRQADQLHSPLDRHALLFACGAQDPFRLGLGKQEDIVITAGDPREVHAEKAFSVAIDAASETAIPQSNHLLGKPSLFQQLQGPRLHADRPRSCPGSGQLVDDANTNSQARQFQGSRQPGRPGTHDQHRVRHVALLDSLGNKESSLVPIHDLLT